MDGKLMKRFLFLLLLFFGIAAECGEHKSFPAEAVRLKNGMPVIVKSAGARRAAETLSKLLTRIYGKPFPVQDGDGRSGIAVGIPGDFPGIAFQPEFDLKSVFEQQGFEIKSHPDGLWIIGASGKAVEYAVYELLYRIGWRHFMPSDKWEIFPETPPEQLALHIREIPDYATRMIQTPVDIHYSKWFSKAEKALKQRWLLSQRNGGFDLHTYHIFEKFVRMNRKLLDAHPEYLSLFNGKRISAQLCLSNPELRRVFIEWQLKNIRQNPGVGSVSVDPADNTKWCQCKNCRAMGSPSTRITNLANETIRAIRAAGLKQQVAFYAYNAHCAPPDIKVEPGVIVNVCTAFLRYGWTADKLVGAWQKQNAVCGIREYYYVGRVPSGGNSIVSLEYAKRTIPEFYRQGARYMNAEFSGHFGSCLPVVNAAFRMLWDVNCDAEAVVEDFVVKAFPASQAEMREFFRLMNREPLPDMSEDLLARFYGLLAQARRKAAGREAEMMRLDDFTAFIRFAEMSYKNPENLIPNMQFIDATRHSKLIYSYSANRHTLRYRGKAVNDKIGWRSHSSPSRSDVEKFIADGLKNNKRLSFQPVSFSKNLVPVKFSSAVQRGVVEPVRWKKEYYIWSDGKPFTLVITGGLIKKYRNRGNVKLELIQIGGESDAGTMETVVCRDETTPPDGKAHKVTMRPKYPGLHRLTVSDGGDRTRIVFPADIICGFDSSVKRNGADSGTFFFYVPKGTKVLGFYQDSWRGTIVAPDGKTFKLGKKKGYYSFKVASGQSGKVWKLHYFGGNLKLITVPPQFSLQNNLMLLPEDIVKKDGLFPLDGNFSATK